jgi:uncharacterized membrane protein
MIVITGCDKKKADSPKEISVANKYLSAVLNNDGNILINSDQITEVATFYNYEFEGVTIQLIAVRASDGTVRVVFNTCQSCNPDKNAYFIQEGDYIVCQTCGTRIKIDDIGFKGVGCSPFYIPDEHKTSDGSNIIISKQYIESFKEKFENWKGKLA